MKGAYSLRFSRSAPTYEKWAIPQKESAKKLIELVKPRGYVLDLGCGTGFISSLLPDGCIPFGLDIAPGMLRVYKSRFSRAVLGDAENLPFPDKSFDYVLSNFSLHWTSLGISIKESIRVARHGVGIAIPVEGSLEGLDFPFPKEEFVTSLLGEYELVVRKERITIPFKGLQLVKFFHYTGSSLNPNRKRVLSKREISNLINSIEVASFHMLFLYVKVS